MATSRELFARARADIVEVTPAEVESKLNDEHVVFLDVREADEHEQGTIPGTHHIPRGFLELQVEGRIPDKSTEVVIYCAGGVRSALAAKTMQELGYSNVSSLIGGFNRWKDEGRT